MDETLRNRRSRNDILNYPLSSSSSSTGRSQRQLVDGEYLEARVCRFITIGSFILVAAILLMIGLMIPLFRNWNKLRDIEANCAVCQPLPGPKGDPGVCTPGQNGRDGKDGICISSPFCDKGDPGEDGESIVGPQGPEGPVGPAGLDGICTEPCVNGTNGIDGAVGPQGIQGDPGVCDCFDLGSVNGVDFGDNITCSSPLPDECMGPITDCPDLSLCDIRAATVGSIGSFNVGEPTGSIPTGGIRAYFGNYSPFFPTEQWLITLFEVFSIEIYARATSLFELYSEGNMDLTTEGDFNLESQNRVSISSTGGSLGVDISAGSNSLDLQGSSVDIQGSDVDVSAADTFTVDTEYSQWTRPTIAPEPEIWFELSGLTYECEVPGAGVPAEVTEDVGNTEGSFALHKQLAIFNDSPILAVNGSLVLGPELDICGGLIFSSATQDITIDAQQDIYLNSTNSVYASRNLVVGGSFIDLHGGRLFSSESPDVVIEADQDIYLNATGTAWVENDLRVGGDLDVTGSITATGACCTSDERVKENVSSINGEKATNLLGRLNPVTFNFKAEYIPSERLNAGLIAQQVERVIPGVVEQRNRFGMQDFRSIYYNDLVAYLIASNQHLHERIIALEKKINQ